MMLSMKKLACTVILMLFPFGYACAVKVSSLYQAEMPVISQSIDDRDQVTKQGFLQVLIKLTGDLNIDKNYAVKQEMARAEYYVKDFSYSAPTTSSSQYFVKIRYDKDALNDLLHKAGVSYWGDNRPLILVWQTISDNHQPSEIVGEDSPAPVLYDLKLTGKKYGLPLIFPMLDVTDVNAVSPEDVNQINLPVLQAAGQRYAPEALLIGNIKEVNNGYQGDWQLMIDNEKWHYVLSNKSIDQLIEMMFNQVSQTLASRYLPKADMATSVWMRLIVSNVKKQKDFKLLMQYLTESGCVKQMQLSQVKGDSVELSVQLDGSLDKFMQTALEDEHLVFRDQDKYSNTLTYEWVR